MKRFYQNVSLVASPGGYEIHLDGKPVKTPARNTLLTKTRSIAEVMVEEWERQGEHISPDTMPITQLVMTAIDKISLRRVAHEAEILGYLDTDLLCYRAPETEPVGRRQKETWDPVLQWFSKRYGVVLSTTTELIALNQSAVAHQRVREDVQKLNDLRFTLLHLVTTETGSLILGLAFLDRQFEQEAVFQAAMVEDLFRAEIYLEDFYGVSPDQEKRRNKLRAELRGASFFLSLLTPPLTDQLD